MREIENQKSKIKNRKSYTFQQVLLKDDRTNGAYLEIPEEIGKEFFPKGRVKMKAKIEGIDYQGSLVKMGKPCFILGVLKSIRQQSGKDFGDIFNVTFYEDLEERTVEIPELIKAEFEKEPLLALNFNKLSYSRRKELMLWFNDAKREETREKRLQKIIDLMM